MSGAGNHVDRLLELLGGRTDAISVLNADGGYQCLKPDNGQFKKTIGEHATGLRRAGVYLVDDNDTVKACVIDVDCHSDDSQRDLMHLFAFNVHERLTNEGIINFVELSKGGFGNYHLWIFFDAPIEAALVRSVLHALVEDELSKLQLGEQDTKPNFEIFPKQDALNGGIGNCINLPLFPPDVQEGRTVFVDRQLQIYIPDFKKNSIASLKFLEKILPKAKPKERSEGIGLLTQDVPKGARHNTLARLVGTERARGHSEEETLLITSIWNERLTDSLPEREVRETVHSLYAKESLHKKQFEETKSFDLFRGSNMSTMQIPNEADLLKGILRAKSLAFLAGEEGSGKSLLAMNLGISVATGALKFLAWIIEQPGKVIFLNNELYFEDVVRRFQYMINTLPGRGSLDNFIAPREVPPLAECFGILNQLCESEKPALVLLDCLYFAHNEDENDSSKMKDLMRQLQSLRDNHGTCVLVVHHLKKGGRDQRLNSELMRGAGVFGAAADSILMLRRSQTEESKRIIRATKLRHSGDDNKTARLLSLNPETLWFSDCGEANEDEHISSASTAGDIVDFEAILSGGEMRFGEILKACEGYGYNQKTIQRQLNEAVEGGKVHKPRHGWYAIPEMDMASK